MTLTGFIDDAYKGKVRKKKRLEKRSGNFVLGFEGLHQQTGKETDQDRSGKTGTF